MNDVTAAYIHIPFCKKICHYCAFNKYFYDGQPIDRYLSALDQEMAKYMKTHSKKAFDTIYIGGGTPSCLTVEEMDSLLQSICNQLPMDHQTEFTIEINPGELTIEKCQVIKSYGVNRVSMGVQTFNDRLLRKIGRNHRQKHVYQSIDWLQRSGLDNLSIDLIFRLPEQTMEDFKESIEKAIELELPHYSLYSLIIENQTVFQQMQRNGTLKLPSEDVDADMFELAIAELDKVGINQYEVSNFAKPGYESRHNLKYWHYAPYYGFGAGAHGFISGERYYNYGPVHHYLKAVETSQFPVIHRTVLSKTDKMEEFVFLGLRTTKGISKKEFNHLFGEESINVFDSFFQQQQKQGLLLIEEDRVRLTKRGLFLADTVFRQLLGTLSDKEEFYEL